MFSAALWLAAILGWTLFPARGLARQRPEASGLRADTITVDACAVAAMDQLRFVVTAGLARMFPLRENQEGTTLSLTEPKLDTATCPNLRVNLALALREEPNRGNSAPAIMGTARLALTLSATASFTAGPGKPAHSAAALADAALCVRRVESVDLRLKGGSPSVTQAWLAPRMEFDLIRRGCFDVTSLVYVFLQRGGSLTPSH